MNKLNNNLKNLTFIIFFSIWFFTSFNCDIISIHFMSTKNSGNLGINIYILSTLCSSLGTLTYYFLRTKFSKLKNIDILIAIIYITWIITVSILNTILKIYLYPFGFIVIAIFIGFNLGIILNILYVLHLKGEFIGRMCGLSLAFGTIIRYIFILLVPESSNNFLYINLILIVILTIIMLWLLLFKIKTIALIMPNTKEISPSKRPEYIRYICTIAAISIIFSFLIGANDNIVIHGGIEIQNSKFVIAQLFYIPGLIIAGFVTDIKRGVYLPIACLCNVVLLIPTVLFLKSPASFVLNSGMAYFAGGFFLIYIFVSFLMVAEKAKNPMFFMCIPGIIFSLFCSVGAFSMSYLAELSEIALISIYTLLIVLFFILFSLSGSLHIFSDKPVSKPDDYSEFIEKYNLTERESEVFEYLMTGMSAIDIGEKLFITERTVRHHITNIYSKTGAKTRLELFLIVKK